MLLTQAQNIVLGPPALLFCPLRFEGIWPFEEKLAVENSLRDSKHKPCFIKQELTLLLKLILGLID